jgi:hypothetical protein
VKFSKKNDRVYNFLWVLPCKQRNTEQIALTVVSPVCVPVVVVNVNIENLEKDDKKVLVRHG